MVAAEGSEALLYGGVSVASAPARPSGAEADPPAPGVRPLLVISAGGAAARTGSSAAGRLRGPAVAPDGGANPPLQQSGRTGPGQDGAPTISAVRPAAEPPVRHHDRQGREAE
jgi:hypothetical protein